MLMFMNDYQEGAAPQILLAFERTNLEQTVGYGEDVHCRRAAEMIRERFECPDADVHFLTGGTQVNLTVLAHILRPYQGVISAATGHIAVHETGAVEASGHKVIAIEGKNGKISGETVDEWANAYEADATKEHMVEPGCVYISQPTEYGTLYTLEELENLRAATKKHGMKLYADGARLGYGLAAAKDVSCADMARLTDAFTIGGTKQGALFGEALVITDPSLKKGFRNMMKRHGGMLAKGRLLGIQFEELMRDDLYFELSRGAVDKAMRIRNRLSKLGIPVYFDSPTNQQFPCLTDAQASYLSEHCAYNLFGKDGEKTVVRLCTSWATKDEDVDALLDVLDGMAARRA